MTESRTQAERITALEVKVERLGASVDSMDTKLDDLLSLRNRGMGAFWLASVLFGTTLLGFITMVVGWFKHG